MLSENSLTSFNSKISHMTTSDWNTWLALSFRSCNITGTCSCKVCYKLAAAAHDRPIVLAWYPRLNQLTFALFSINWLLPNTPRFFSVAYFLIPCNINIILLITFQFFFFFTPFSKWILLPLFGYSILKCFYSNRKKNPLDLVSSFDIHVDTLAHKTMCKSTLQKDDYLHSFSFLYKKLFNRWNTK